MAKRTIFNQRQIADGIVLCKDLSNGLAWIVNSRTGMAHSCHPNIDITGSISGMKSLGYWEKKDRIVRSHGFQYNIDKFVIDTKDEFDILVAAECMCIGCQERRKNK